ncbi:MULTISPECIES: photosystem II reaction center protein J [Planktothricoides]|uniref:Photosystem II reaction center protein J n=2 Tax=Planktothricoides raciborskii TaxID=132608 RepID=A0AAU8JF58_9CYAN|nr:MULTISPECIES: photosystem II reaction center protein J [Planktothricoides]MBD2545932.1 photosystem II reaction center protein J [Planktothricoides raciborskii FACHB-1370]MBD2584049.1 photosystem II reaction center protein J [Planktothricoides raciborskii FACHB-1261]
MSEPGRIPLWLVATVAGLGVIAVVGLFFYGAYAGIGSSM